MKRNSHKFYSLLLILLLFIGDALALLAILELSLLIRSSLPQELMPLFEEDAINKYYWLLVITLLIFIFEKLYTIRRDFWSETKIVLKSFLLSFIAVLTIITLVKVSQEYSRSFIVIFFLLSMILIPIFKRSIKKYLFRFKIFKINVKIIASIEQLEILKQELDDNFYFGFQAVEKNFDMLIISSKNFSPQKLQEVISLYSEETKDIYVIPYMENLDFSHATIVNYSNIRLSAIHLHNRLLNRKNIYIKQIFEKSITLLLLPFIILLHIIISLAIKMSSNSDVLFKQKRLGQNKESFEVYKYTTMFSDSQKILDDYLKENPDEITHYQKYHKYKNDPRITKIGRFLRKTSLDELPQFINVLKGEMNLIGPRPYMTDESHKIGHISESTILKVKPGITGLWQVSGRNNLTFQQRVELETWYIKNWSLWLDFVILMKTIITLINKTGAK